MQRRLNIVDFVRGEGSERPGGWGGMGFGRKVGLDWMGKRFFFLFFLILTHREH